MKQFEADGVRGQAWLGLISEQNGDLLGKGREDLIAVRAKSC